MYRIHPHDGTDPGEIPGGIHVFPYIGAYKITSDRNFIMSTKLFVGNLSWNTNDDTLRNAFSNFGHVVDTIVMKDRETGRSRGFGFVTYGTKEEAEAGMEGLNEQELDGRRIRVNIANERKY
ncbi:hypothetical protein OPQ81_010527 [Rhizoctonia solani]|nr:hypothetical protein OPQ81_010527 [Rhizoctonia solani]